MRISDWSSDVCSSDLCPGCAWPDRDHTSTFEFCENGAKAVAAEATKHRATPELFAKHGVAELARYSDHWLEDQGRLTHPMRLDAASGHYVPVSWDEAFRSEEHTSELQSLMRISYAVFCLQNKK